jgi:hypothetical protein
MQKRSCLLEAGPLSFVGLIVARMQCSGCAEKREDSGFDLFCGEGFADVALCACGNSAEDEGLAALGCNHDDGDSQGQILLSALLEKLESVHDGHINVAQDQCEGTGVSVVVPKSLQCFFAVRGLQYFRKI